MNKKNFSIIICQIVFDQIEELVGIKIFDDTKVLIDTNDKLPDDITLKDVVILMTCFIKDGDKFIQNYFQKKHCMINKHSNDI